MTRPEFIARCTLTSFSWPVRRNSPKLRRGWPSMAYSVINAPFSGWLMKIARPVYSIAASPLSTRLRSVTRATGRPGRRNPRSVEPLARKICTRGLPPGASATRNVPSGARSNAVGSSTRPCSAPISISLRRRIETGRRDVDRMRAAVEDEVLACRRLLTAGELLEAAGDVRGKRGDGRQRRDPIGRGCLARGARGPGRRRRQQQREHRRARNAGEMEVASCCRSGDPQ